MTAPGGGELNVDLQGWFAADQTPPPPPIVSDAVMAGTAPIEQLLQVLALAANQGDPRDNLEAQQGHAERKAITSDALEKFPAQDQAAQAEMKGVDQMSQMAQQMPQMIGGVAGAISGALGGALQPLAQIPQQLAQTGQQLLQQGMGAMQQAGKEITPEDLAAQGLDSDILAGDSEIGSGGGGSAGGGGGGMGATTPMSALGPAATPTGSTVPTSGRASVAPPAAPAAHASAPMGGMGGGYPMMPPGAMAGAGGAQDKDDKAATKRVSVPSVKNGAPVQGRISTPPPPAAPTVTKNVDGKPVTTRRIIVPNDKAEAKADSDGKGK
jgi:hypothetical protein